MSESRDPVSDAMVGLATAIRRAMKAMIEASVNAWRRIPEPVREELLWAARERRSIEKYEAAHEAERQAGLAYIRELGAQARRDLGLPEEER